MLSPLLQMFALLLQASSKAAALLWQHTEGQAPGVPKRGSSELTKFLWQCAVVVDLHCDTCLLPKVALPKVYMIGLEADTSAGQLQPDA